MNLLQAIILGIIEGITEFLPVSSTGHIIIGSSVMGIASDPFTKSFTVIIQLGAILSVIVLYWKKFFKVDFSFYRRLLIAFIPSVIAGLIFKSQIEMLLENVVVVAVALLIGGIIFLRIDKWFAQTEKNGSEVLQSDKSAFLIGCFQVISMIPGVSRSGATIIGGLTQKLNRKGAAEFSFFLAVPTMFGATCKDIYDFYSKGDGIGFTGEQIGLLVVGNIVAFFVAALAIRSFIAYLTQHGFKIFGYYRIAVGLILLFLYFAGIPMQILN